MNAHPSTAAPARRARPQGRRRTIAGCLPRRGAVTMEMAMVVPVFFLLVFGIIEVGRGFMVSHLLANAARDGCRAGTIEGTSTETIRTIVTEKLAALGVQGATVSIRVNGEEQEAATAGAGAKISVGATIPVSAFTWLPGGSFLKGSLGGEYSLHRE